MADKTKEEAAHDHGKTIEALTEEHDRDLTSLCEAHEEEAAKLKGAIASLTRENAGLKSQVNKQATRNNGDAKRPRFAVYRNPGPGVYEGELIQTDGKRKHVLPPGQSVSLPPTQHTLAKKAGLVFERWARGS